MKTMKAWNFFVSAIFILLGFATIALSSEFPIEMGKGDPGSGFWPTVLGIIIIALGIMLAIISAISKNDKLMIDLKMASPGAKRVYWMISLTMVFGVLMYFGGMLIALFIFAYLSMGLMDVKSKKERLLFSLILVGSVYLIFQVLLKSPLPPPIFMR
jgi:hypothetical protein